MLRWFCVQRAAWAALSRLSDGLEADAAKLNINEAKDVFAEWFQNIKAQVLPRICPADTASEWMFQDFKMFNHFVPGGNGDYIRSKCECRGTVDCLSATEAQCLHKKCTACESDEHCDHLENTKRCDKGKCVATSSSVTTTPPPRCWDNDAGLTNEWSTWIISTEYFCSYDITYCDTESDVMKKFCPKFCGYCGPPRPLTFALSYDDISDIFHHIDNRTNTRVSNDTWEAANWMSNLVLTGVETRNIIFPTAKKWLRARSSQSEHKSRLSINITDIKVDADTNMTVTYGFFSVPTMSTLSMTISNVEIYLPLPSLEIHSNNRLLLTLQSDGDHVCRASHESLPTVEGAESSSVVVSEFMGLLLKEGVKRDMRRLIVQTLEDSCSYGRTIYKSAFEVAKDMLNTWQDITSVPFGNRDWSVSTSDFVSQARGLSGIFTDKHSPFSFKKLLSTVNKDTLIQLVQTSISDWSESKNESVSRAHTSSETIEPPITLPQSGPEITIAYPFGHEKIPLGADFLAGFGSANAMLVEVQLHGLSSLEDIAITLEDNNYSTASVQLFGTFGMNIIVELEFRLNEMDEGDVTFSALETVKRKYQVSVSGVVNPSFGVDFGVVANLHDLDSALKAAFSPASLFKAFWDMDPKMDAGDQIHETLVRVKSCIARHLITGSGITGIKIAKVNFDAGAIERVHVISVDAECKSFEELKLFDQIICGVMDAADIIYAALFNDHHVLPRLVDTVLREPAVMDAVNTYLSTYLLESIASAENQAECPAPDEPPSPEVPPESVSDSEYIIYVCIQFFLCA